VLEAILYFFPATIELSLYAIFPIIIGGVWLGVRSAVNHNKPVDHGARIFAMVGTSFPTFVFALLMLMIFYANLKWFPPGRLDDWATVVVNSDSFRQFTGMYSVDGILNGRLDVTLNSFQHMLLPIITLSYIYWALFLRVTRSSMLEVLNQDYIRTARAKGLSDDDVINKHALRNALIPVATIGGLTFVGLLNGVIITETVFNYRGMGWFAANSALRLDVISVLGITLFTAILYVMANLVVDIIYVFLDPRVRVS
jgi:peptide/nickel transport system permease protein